MAGENTRKIQPGSTIILKGCFSIESLSTLQILNTQFTISMASSTCDQSSGFYSEKLGRYTTFNERTVDISRHEPSTWSGARISCLPFPLTKLLSGWNIIDYLWQKQPEDWFLTSFEMFLLSLIVLFWLSVLVLRARIVPLDFWTKCTNKTEVFGHKELYRTKQTFVV